MVDAFAAARRIAAGIATDADRAWLQAGMATWLRAGGELSLERCLKLNGRRRGVLAQRDELLLELRDAVGGPEAMLRSIAYFTVTSWPRWRGLAVAPAGASYLQRIAFDLLNLRCPIPTTSRGIRKALATRNEVAANRSACRNAMPATSDRHQREPEHANPNP